MGLHRAGFDVVGVDIRPQPRYPFEFHQVDALTFPLDGFDFVWASPPCQRYTLAQRIQGNDHPDLVDPIRERFAASGVPSCIENVERAPLHHPVMLCGSMFGLRTYRHRLFECSFPVIQPPHPEHAAPITKMGRRVADGSHMHIVGNFSNVALARDIMDMPWASRDGLREAIPPVYAEYIGRSALAFIEWQNRRAA